MSSTESELRMWRYGQTQSERLIAALLRLEGYKDVDPQHPLGGPDGRKDVLCKRDGRVFVAASYFPGSTPSDRELKDKFEYDYEGVKKNAASGFAFFVNQHLTLSARAQLLGLARDEDAVEIYHLERMIGLLDSPAGCGIRLEYLRIAMSESEQWAFWSQQNSAVLSEMQSAQQSYDARLSVLEQKLDFAVAQTSAVYDELRQALSTSPPSSILDPAQTSAVTESTAPTRFINVAVLCWIHSIIMSNTEMPVSAQGVLRSMNVVVGTADGTEPIYAPPAPSSVPGKLAELLRDWVESYDWLALQGQSEVVDRLARFHCRFLEIHSFLDGNGRVSRHVVDQASQELLGRRVSSEFVADVPRYQAALLKANDGDLEPLKLMILAALS